MCPYRVTRQANLLIHVHLNTLSYCILGPCMGRSAVVIRNDIPRLDNLGQVWWMFTMAKCPSLLAAGMCTHAGLPHGSQCQCLLVC